MPLQKPLLDKELWAAWEASGGTALLDPFQLLSKVLKRHPELEKRFTGEQWRVQRRLALRRLGLPESECGWGWPNASCVVAGQKLCRLSPLKSA